MKARLASCAVALLLSTQAVAHKPDPGIPGGPGPTPPPEVPALTDLFTCTLRYYGTLDREGMPETERGGALIESSSTMGSVRNLAITPAGQTAGTIGWASMYSTLGDSGLKAELGILYQHRIVAVPDGGLKAYQRVILSGRLWKGSTLLTENNGPPSGRPGETPFPSPGAPSDGWSEVKLLGGVPQLTLDGAPIYVETVGNQGVLQLRCHQPGLFPVGKVRY